MQSQVRHPRLPRWNSKKASLTQNLYPMSKWSFAPFYTSNEAWSADLALLQGFIDRLASYKGTLASAARLAEFFKLSEENSDINHRLYYYVHLQNDLATDNTELKGKTQIL